MTKRKWTISPEKRARLEEALDRICQAHCAYLAGEAPSSPLLAGSGSVQARSGP